MTMLSKTLAVVAAGRLGFIRRRRKMDPPERSIPMVRRRSDSLALLVAASVLLLAAQGAMAQSSTDSASLHWATLTTLPPSALVSARFRRDIGHRGHGT